jgi:peptidoglycan/LPS O-acetylase OafA/YrhL
MSILTSSVDTSVVHSKDIGVAGGCKAAQLKVSQRLQGLDFLRGLAVLWVILHQWDLPFADAASYPLLFSVLNVIHRAGWLGVDLFFVLSGFLVGGLLFLNHRRTGCLNVGQFLIRRAFKIYPLFYAFLGITVLIPLLRGTSVEWKRVFAEACFVQNYFERLHVHTWSLAVEEHFYLLLPLLLTFAIWRAQRTEAHRENTDPFFSLVYWVPVIMACCLILRTVTALKYPFQAETHLFPSHLRLDSLFLGVLLAYFQSYRSEQFHRFAFAFRYPLIFLAALLILPAFFLTGSNFFMHTFGQTCFALAFGGLLLSVVANEPDSQ